MGKKKVTKKQPNKNTKRVTKKQTTKKFQKKKGFTLIELLAVIIILGILMIIAIPSVTRYINDSRKSAYVDTAKEIVSGTRNLVNEGKLEMYDTDTTYYISQECIQTENASKSPYGEFKKAYVVVTYNGTGYDYYWTSVDDAGQGIKKITKIDNLDENSIESDLTENDIHDSFGIDGRSKYMIIDKQQTNCGKGVLSSVTGTINGKTGESEVTAAQFISGISELSDVAEAKRYTGPNPNNFVKFNGNELWRIIGVYGDSLKIFKVEAIGKRQYNSSSSAINTWANSNIKEYLNNDYYQSLSGTAKSMIKENASWYAGNVEDDCGAATAFEEAKTITWTGNVGLIASYEYLYAASNETNCWELSGYRDFGSNKCGGVNWIGSSNYNWTMSPSNYNSYLVLSFVYPIYRASPTDNDEIKPVVYLKSSVKITGGTGTSSDPYTLGL